LREERKGEGGGPWGSKKRNGKKRRNWAGPKEKERGKMKCIQMHLNLNLKFKSKWKTSNKTMQCGMKCTRPILPYVSFYS
jgi:hypothetical protein